MAEWFVRAGGSDNNGGSSSSLTPDRSGTDMTVTQGATQVTSASAAFVAGDVGKGINIAGVVYRIATVTNGTTIQLDRNYAATGGSNKTWAIGGALATLGKVWGAASQAIVQAGDTFWLGAGVHRGTYSLSGGFASAVTIAGDVDGVKTGDVGEVRLTACANDKTAVTTALFNFGSFYGLTFKNIFFVGSSGDSVTGASILRSVDAAYNLTFTDCAFLSLDSGQYLCHWVVGGSTRAYNILFERCRVLTRAGFNWGVSIGAGDLDINVAYKNCMIISTGTGVRMQLSGGSASNHAGGIRIYDCTILSGSDSFLTPNYASTVVPCVVENSLLTATSGYGISAGVSGSILETYNSVQGGSGPRNNTATGTGSTSSYSSLIHFGQELFWGAASRPLGMPAAGSPLLGFGASANAQALDILGVTRPAGGASASHAAGATERGNTWVKETTTTHTGSTALSITGPGYIDFDVPVAAVSTTVSVYFRYDSTYAGTRPTLAIIKGTEAGVANDSSVVSTSALNDWAQASVTFTPVRAGIVTARLLSNDTNGAGKAFADSFTVA